jgi:CNT family concentrative nucleoside transporter
MERFIGLLGIVFFIGLTCLLSKHKSKIKWQLIVVGLAIQFAVGILLIGIPAIGVPGVLSFLFEGANAFFVQILSFTDKGAGFLFGPLIDPAKIGDWIFAFKVLPTIIFFSSLMAVLYYLGIMQKIVRFLALLMQKSFKISGAESLATSANIFLGQTEAPLVIRPYIDSMTKSELLVLMVGGMATVAGGVLAAFVGMLQTRIPNIGGHLLTASVMSAPAAILIAKLLLPETEVPKTLQATELKEDKIEDTNVIEAAARGASEGLGLALNVAAMLLAFIALIAFANWGLESIGSFIGFSRWGHSITPEVLLIDGTAKLSLEVILSWLFSPIAFLMGVPWSESAIVGALLGKKLVLNEFVAYIDLMKVMPSLSDKSIIITSYALCGFANFSSIGIQIGGIGGLAPERKSDLARLGLWAVYGGSVAAFLTAVVAGILL